MVEVREFDLSFLKKGKSFHFQAPESPVPAPAKRRLVSSSEVPFWKVSAPMLMPVTVNKAFEVRVMIDMLCCTRFVSPLKRPRDSNACCDSFLDALRWFISLRLRDDLLSPRFNGYIVFGDLILPMMLMVNRCVVNMGYMG